MEKELNLNISCENDKYNYMFAVGESNKLKIILPRNIKNYSGIINISSIKKRNIVAKKSILPSNIVKINIPDSYISNLNIYASEANILVRDLIINKLDIELKKGNIKVRDCHCSDTVIDSDKANITFDSVSGDNSVISNNRGNVYICESSFDDSFVNVVNGKIYTMFSSVSLKNIEIRASKKEAVKLEELENKKKKMLTLVVNKGKIVNKSW